jgi:hypothetical protein
MNASAESASDKLNAAIVGRQTQNRNRRIAAEPRINGTVASERTSQSSAWTAGATSMQPGAIPGTAGAVGVTSTQPGGGSESSFDATVRDLTSATDRPSRYSPFAIEFAPLGLFTGGRIELTGEWAPVTHNVITVSPYFVHTTSDVAFSGDTTVSQAFTGVGTEVGYRYYTGHNGMNGVFVGPSLILGIYNAGLPAGNQEFTNIGLAGDVGLQEVFLGHVVVGGGLGLEYLQVSHDFHDLPTGPSTVASTGLKPRVVLEAGYGF